MLPDMQKLRTIIDYDAHSGLMRWRERPASDFASQSYADRWNLRFAGKPAFATATTHGLVGYLDNRAHPAHRVAFKWLHGVEPQEVDHINGDPCDNSARNLRGVTHAENLRNQKLRSTNTSGQMGVDLHRGRWRARIKANGKTISLGSFNCKEAAVSARLAAERAYGFHQNHGRAA